jgi:hypothetical protein
MNHSTCDGCGNALLANSEVRYEVRIEVKAAYDPLEISAGDLEKDYRTEMANLMLQLAGLSAAEAQNQIYRAFDFDLCPACQRRYIGNLLAKSLMPGP